MNESGAYCAVHASEPVGLWAFRLSLELSQSAVRGGALAVAKGKALDAVQRALQFVRLVAAQAEAATGQMQWLSVGKGTQSGLYLGGGQALAV